MVGAAAGLIFCFLASAGVGPVGAATCPSVQNTPHSTIAYGQALIGGSGAPVGAVVEARTPRGETAGCFTITAAGNYGAMYVYGEDTSVSPAIPGMRTCEVVSFYLDGVLAASSPPLVWSDDRDVHRADPATGEATGNFQPSGCPTAIEPSPTAAPGASPTGTTGGVATPTPSTGSGPVGTGAQPIGQATVPPSSSTPVSVPSLVPTGEPVPAAPTPSASTNPPPPISPQAASDLATALAGLVVPPDADPATLADALLASAPSDLLDALRALPMDADPAALADAVLASAPPELLETLQALPLEDVIRAVQQRTAAPAPEEPATSEGESPGPEGEGLSEPSED